MKKRYGGAKADYNSEKFVVQGRTNRLSWFLFGVSAGLFLAFSALVYYSSFDLALVLKHGGMKKDSATMHAKVTAPIVEAVQPVKVVQAAKPMPVKPAPVSKPKPKYEFYKMLKQEQVLKKPSKTTVQPVQSKLSDGYYLKVGAFKSTKEAQALREKLIAAGYDAAVRKVVINGVNWDRVVLGPYSTIKEAYSTQSQLKVEHYQAVLLRNDFAA